jgi:hypothetical protein
MLAHDELRETNKVFWYTTCKAYLQFGHYVQLPSINKAIVPLPESILS